MPESPPDLAAILLRLERIEAELAAAKSELAAAKAEIARKDQIIAALQQRLFGAKSERLDPAQMSLMFEEALLGKPEPLPDQPAGSEEASPDNRGGRSRRTKAELYPRNLPIQIVGELVPAEVLADPAAYREIEVEYHDELEVKRAEMCWHRTVRRKYVSAADRTRPPVMEPAPLPTVPGTLIGAGLAAQIVVDKYVDHLPHYRQSTRFWRCHRAELSRQTINQWTHAVAAHLRPIGEAIKAELTDAAVLQIDETPASYLSPGHGKSKTGYYWVYLDPGHGTVYYDWQLSRGHECLGEILGIDEHRGTARFGGTIQCDGYAAYTAFASRYGGIRLGACLAHIRRKFWEARKEAPETALPILLAIQRLYEIEAQLRQSKAPPECRGLVRQARSRIIVEEIKTAIDQRKSRHLPRSAMGEALEYALAQWERFEGYLRDGRMEIDNNLVENAIRPTKLGLKNHLFIGAAEAGAASALLYTLVANCKAAGIDPEWYLAEAIRRLRPGATPEQVAALTPARLAPMLQNERLARESARKRETAA